LVKPLLAPLLLVPAFRRQWLALVRTVLPGGVVLVVACAVVPGGRDFERVLRYCLSGTNLHGQNAVNNLSLRGWTEAHHCSPILGLVASAIVVAVVLFRLGWTARSGRGLSQISPLRLANLVLLATLLAGRISESHFLLVVISSIALQILAERSVRSLLWYLPGLVLLGVPVQYVNSWLGLDLLNQSCMVAAELLLLLGGLATGPLRPATPLVIEEIQLLRASLRSADRPRQPVVSVGS